VAELAGGAGEQDLHGCNSVPTFRDFTVALFITRE
jgi:hypothetical protein